MPEIKSYEVVLYISDIVPYHMLHKTRARGLSRGAYYDKAFEMNMNMNIQFDTLIHTYDTRMIL